MGENKRKRRPGKWYQKINARLLTEGQKKEYENQRERGRKQHPLEKRVQDLTRQVGRRKNTLDVRNFNKS